MIPQQHDGGPALRVGGEQRAPRRALGKAVEFVAHRQKFAEKFKRPRRRLRDPVHGVESIAPVEGCEVVFALLVDVGQIPIQAAIAPTLDARQGAGDERGVVAVVVVRHERARRGVPLAPDDRTAKPGRVGLLAHALEVPVDKIHAEQVHVAVRSLHERHIGWIDVRAHKIDRRAVARAPRQQIGDPRGAGGGRAAHAETRVHPLHGVRRRGVEFKISFLIARPERDVRLVPHLEPPTGDLVDAVGFHKKADGAPHEFGPRRVVFGRRGDARVMADFFDGIRRERGGHERQLEERFHAGLEPGVHDALQAREAVVQRAVAIAENHADVIAQHAVAAQMRHPQLLMRAPHLLLHVGPHDDGRMTGVETKFPDAPQRTRGGGFGGETADGGRRHGGDRGENRPRRGGVFGSRSAAAFPSSKAGLRNRCA
jgi:hypothetical protein